MDMDCKSSADLVARSLSGNAASQDDASLRAHLAACAACAALERRLARTWALMGQLQPVASKAPVPAAPRKSVLRSPLWIVGTAAAAVLVVSAVVLSLMKPDAVRPEPVAVQSASEDAHPDQRDEESRVQEVLTRIDIETDVKTQAPVPPVVPPAPPVAVPDPVAPREGVTAKAADPAPAERRETLKSPVAETRPVEKAGDKTPLIEAPLPVIATVDRVEGDVFAMVLGKRTPVLSGHKLLSGDFLETAGKGGQAVVEFPDGTRLVLGADTIVDSIRFTEGKRVSLKQGVLAAQVSKQPAGEPMVFMTASAEARVLGTRLTLSIAPNATRLEVREGKVKLTRKDDGASVDVQAGQFVLAGKGSAMTPKPVTSVRIAMHETFDRPRWGGAWQQSGDANMGVRMASENGSLTIKTLAKPVQDTGSTKMPNDAAEAARKVLSGPAGTASSKKEWPRGASLETRQAFPFSNETPLRIRTRAWNSHHDPDRVSWLAVNRGVSGQGLSIERRGGSLQLWVEGAAAPVWKKDAAGIQEWESLELWISKDQMVVRRNEETLYAGANPLKVKAVTLSIGSGARLELAQDEEIRFDDVDVILTTRAELEEVAR